MPHVPIVILVSSNEISSHGRPSSRMTSESTTHKQAFPPHRPADEHRGDGDRSASIARSSCSNASEIFDSAVRSADVMLMILFLTPKVIRRPPPAAPCLCCIINGKQPVLILGEGQLRLFPIVRIPKSLRCLLAASPVRFPSRGVKFAPYSLSW